MAVNIARDKPWLWGLKMGAHASSAPQGVAPSEHCNFSSSDRLFFFIPMSINFRYACPKSAIPASPQYALY